jgi:hypothetical protein
VEKGAIGSLLVPKRTFSAMHQVHLLQWVQGTNVSLMRKKRARDDSWRPVPVRCHILDPLAASDMTCRSGWTALWWPNHMRVSSILTVFDILNVFRYIYCKGFKVRTSPWCEKGTRRLLAAYTCQVSHTWPPSRVWYDMSNWLDGSMLSQASLRYWIIDVFRYRPNTGIKESAVKP